MNHKIITVEEAVNEMMNGEIVRMPKDKGTFFDLCDTLWSDNKSYVYSSNWFSKK